MRHESRFESIFILAGIAALLGAMTLRYIERRPPYFAKPATIVDHVDRHVHDNQLLLLLLPKIERMIPRGAEVTCFRPANGEQQFDGPNYLAAVGLLPHRTVLPPFTAAAGLPPDQLVEYVISVGGPFTNPAYREVARFPEGSLYKVMR